MFWSKNSLTADKMNDRGTSAWLEVNSKSKLNLLFNCHTLNWGQLHGLIRQFKQYHNLHPTSMLTYCLSGEWEVVPGHLIPLGSPQSVIKYGQIHHWH